MRPGEYIGAVTQGRYSAPHFICADFPFSFCVGLCSCGNVFLQATWQHPRCWMQLRQWRCFNRVDLSPRDHHQNTCAQGVLSHAINGRLVASQGGVDLHRMALIKSRLTALKATCGLISTWRWRSDSGNPMIARSWITIAR